MIKTKGRRAAGLAALCALTLTAAACGGESSGSSSGNETANAVKGGTLNLLGTGDVDYMDPNITYYTVGYENTRLWSRSLFTNPTVAGKVMDTVPDAATVIPSSSNGGISSDGMTYTIKIRSDMKWNTSPARTVVAGDFVRGIKRMCNPAQPFGGLPDFETLFKGYQSFCNGFAKVGTTASAIGSYIENNEISGISAPDDTTLKIQLTRPAAYLPSMLSMGDFAAAPKEYDQYVPASQKLGQNTISDGPYQVKSWSPTKSITYARNPAWTASSDPIRKAYVNKIVVNETSTQESVQQQLETNSPSADLAFGTFPPPSRLPQLISTKDPNLNIGPTASSNPYIVFNTVSPNNKGALKNVKVRKALEYAINRANIIQVLGGKTLNSPLTQVIPPSLPSGQKTIDLYSYSPSKAKAMLSSAGYPNGITLKFLYRNSSEASSKTFQTVKQDLTKSGITIQGVASPDADFYTKYLQVPSVAKRGVWDLALAGWGADWYGTGGELSYFQPLFSGKPSFPPTGSNYGLYSSSTENSLISKAVSATTADEATSMFSAADKQVMADAAFFPITQPKQPNYHASQVHNAIYLPTIQNFDPANVWLESGKQGG